MPEDIPRTEEVRVFADVGRGEEADLVDVAFYTPMTGKVEGSIDGNALDILLSVVRTCHRYAHTNLAETGPRGGGNGLSVRPTGEAEYAGEVADKG